MLLSWCRCLILCPPITTFRSFRIGGCMQRPIFQFHSSISFYLKNIQSLLLSSICNPYPCQLRTTKNLKHSMPTRLAIDDLLTHCSADDKLDLFLNIELADLQPHLDHINDKGLVESLKHGIGYYHKALDKQDKQIVQRLFESGAIQVLVASKV